MPFTPLHLGPALAIGLPLRKYVHAPTFIVANVILDIEPLIVLFFGLDYPLHGYLHTLLLAAAVGLILGYAMFKLERHLKPVYGAVLLETGNELGVKSFAFAGVSGAMLHVLFDAPLYADIHPFFPVAANPLLSPGVLGGMWVLMLCVWMGIFGVAFYAALVVFHAYKRLSTRKQ
jgi:hypothetical protein